MELYLTYIRSSSTLFTFETKCLAFNNNISHHWFCARGHRKVNNCFLVILLFISGIELNPRPSWPLNLGVLNGCSIVNKGALVQDLIITKRLDMLAITESWMPTGRPGCCTTWMHSRRIPYSTLSPAVGWLSFFATIWAWQSVRSRLVLNFSNVKQSQSTIYAHLCWLQTSTDLHLLRWERFPGSLTLLLVIRSNKESGWLCVVISTVLGWRGFKSTLLSTISPEDLT